jgi:hypothetical protein
MNMQKVNLAEKLSLFSDYYSPKIVGEINDSHVKLVKLKGEFVWHHHDREDELFLIVKGTLRIQYREGGQEREARLGEGEFLIVPPLKKNSGADSINETPTLTILTTRDLKSASHSPIWGRCAPQSGRTERGRHGRRTGDSTPEPAAWRTKPHSGTAGCEERQPHGPKCS